MYSAVCVDDLRHGVGKLVQLPGTSAQESYEGDWVSDKRNGQGKYTYRIEDGTVYEGTWVDNVRVYGQLTFRDGSFYRGDFTKEQMHGKGLFVYANNSQYDGDWMNNMRYGDGSFLNTDGTIHRGKYERNLKHGPGTLYHPGKCVYKNNIY